MPDWSKVETRRRAAPGPPGWGLGSGLITRSRKKKLITETEIRVTTAPCREAGVQDANTQLEQRAKQRMTHKPSMKLLSPKTCVKIGILSTNGDNLSVGPSHPEIIGLPTGVGL